MADNQNPAAPQTAEETLQQLQQLYAAQQQAAYQDNRKVIDVGREEYGAEAFDSMSADVGAAIGTENIRPFMESIVQCDLPERIIEYLSTNPAEAKQLAHMSPSRRSAALGRIEARLLPHSNGPGTGADPAWKAKSAGRINLNDDAVSDEQWSRAFDRRMKDRQR